MPSQQGTPQQVRKVIDTIMKKERIPTIFSESTISDKPARQVAREAGAHLRRRAVRVDSLSAADGPVPTGARPAARHHRNHRQRYPGRDEEAAMKQRRRDCMSTSSPSPWRNGHTALRDASFKRAARLHCRAGGG